MNIQEFKKKNVPKKISSLKKFEDEILELHNDNFSLKSITQFLKQNDVTTTFQNVAKFIKNSTKVKSKVTQIKSDTKQDEKQKTSFLMPELKKVGKDLELKEAPDWAK